MRNLIALLTVWIIFTGTSTAQLLTVNPAFPKDTSAISIIVDCARGNQGLNNYANTNDVYVHVGVITSLSANGGDWKYAPFTWGTANAAAKAVSLGDSRYQYDISNIRSFFGVPSGETIFKIAILFRSGDGNTVQRNSDGSDMYITVYTDALAAKFAEPFFEPRYIPVHEPINKSVGDRIRINFQSNTGDSMAIYLNGTLIKSALGTNSVADSPFITTSGAQQIVGFAGKGAAGVYDTLNFFVASPVTELPLPDGARDGINYESGDTSAVLVLYAPYKNQVSLIGDFNNWTETTSFQMNRTPDSLRYWLRVTGLTPGTEYAYQYLLDNNLRIADPYTEKVLDPNNDQYITNATYPGLKPYPIGKTTGNVSVLQTAEPAYTWQVSNFSRPDKRNLLIYELLVRDFVEAHDWKTLKDTLSYLKTMGINAIEIMPFNEFEGNISWGYNTSFYFAPDKYYGNKNSLKEFIDACHQQGIAVIMDIALNHSFGQSPMVQMYFDAANGRPAANNPWFNPVPKHAFNVGYDMNHESPATRYLVNRVTQHWLQEYKIDGFRFDLSKGFTQNATCDANGNNCNVGQWGNYDASRVALWKRYYDTVQQQSNGAIVILEHFADNNEEKELSDYGMLLWGNLNHNFNEATMGYLTNSNFENGIHTVRGWTNPHLVTYMESHDEERLMYKNLQFGNASGSYNVKELTTALKRNEMAAAFCFMIPGPKMIWQFGETGYDYSINRCPDGTINESCRTDVKPIQWDYLQHTGRKKLYETYTALLNLRHHALFMDGFVSNRVERSLGGALKWLKITTDTSNILVVGNFDVVAATGNITFQNAGTWFDYLTGQTISATGNAQSITLQPGEYHVYINRNVAGIPTPTTDIDIIETNTRLKIWPNPVVKNAVIEYELPVSAAITISLHNLYGSRLGILYSGFRAKGTYQLPLSRNIVAGKPAGVYFLQLNVGGVQKVQKIIID